MEIKFNSLECQDMFVFLLLGHQTNGYFLDIGCQTPIDASNTYLFEQLGWDGLAFDRADFAPWYGPFKWAEKRKTRRIMLDATTRDLTNALLCNLTPGAIVDYISIDIDDGGLNYGVEGLLRVLNAGITFKVMTFKHEAYRNAQSNGEYVRDFSRTILTKLDYIPLFGDVSLDGGPFEDWWVHPAFFDQKILECTADNLHYKECIKRLQEVLCQK